MPTDPLENAHQNGLTRRQSIAAAAPLALSARALSAQRAAAAPPRTGSILHAVNLQHVNVRVASAERVAEFYQKVFGFPAVRFIVPVVNAPFALDFDNGTSTLVSIMMADAGSKAPGNLDHFCIGVSTI